MPVPSTIADLTTNEATNYPADSDSVTPTTRPSDYIRAHAAIIKTLGNTVDALDAATQPLDATLTAIADESLGAFSHRNKIINGGFSVNQRAYVSGAAVGAGLYGHDRWKMAASADTYTFSTTANKTTVTIPAGKVLQQVIEGLNLQSGTYTLSWEGTAQGKIGAGALSASGVTGSITGGTDTTIEFGPGTVANVQLEFGSVATPFEHRPYGAELALCQRYYWKSFPIGRAPAQNAGDTGAITWPLATSGVIIGGAQVKFPVVMRATPTMTYFNPLAANANARDNAGDGGVATSSYASDSGFFVYALSSAGNLGQNLGRVHATAAIEL